MEGLHQTNPNYKRGHVLFSDPWLAEHRIKSHHSPLEIEHRNVPDRF